VALLSPPPLVDFFVEEKFPFPFVLARELGFFCVVLTGSDSSLELSLKML